MAYVLASEIQWLARTYGIERVGFLTLTFADLVLDIKEAQRRFNNLNRRVLKARYSRAIGVVERQTSGRLHFHLLVVLNADIRTGFDFRAIERRDYRSANQVLRAEWAFWRKTAPKYGFGRTELLPVKSNADGIARYVGKYVSKHIGTRSREDKGARVVRFIGFRPGTRHAFSTFAWNTANGWLWRHKLAAWCKRHDLDTLDELRNIFGRRWAYLLQDDILGERVDECFPTKTSAERSFNLECNHKLKRYQAEDEKEKRLPAGARIYQLKAQNPATRKGVRVIEVQAREYIIPCSIGSPGVSAIP